jgi:hypothetical protein
MSVYCVRLRAPSGAVFEELVRAQQVYIRAHDCGYGVTRKLLEFDAGFRSYDLTMVDSVTAGADAQAAPIDLEALPEF